MDHIGLSRYFVEKGCKIGHSRCDEQKRLKVILFAFMENDACSVRELEKREDHANDYVTELLMRHKETPELAFAGTGVSLSETFLQPLFDCLKEV